MFNDTLLSEITTIRISAVCVMRDEKMRSTAVLMAQHAAHELHMRLMALGDHRASVKVEHRDGIDAWTVEEIAEPDLDGARILSDIVGEIIEGLREGKRESNPTSPR